MDNEVGILLVEDNPGEVGPAIRALLKYNLSNNDLPAS
jgi:hypothetical protein